MKKGTCKLCGKYRELCKKSHLLPKFCYKHLKFEDNSFAQFRYGDKIRRRFNVEYEANILCLDCENRKLGALDDYGSKIINNEGFNEALRFILQKTAENSFLILNTTSGYDYKKFKLFLLSILWRAAISSRNAMTEVSLDFGVETDLRNMILHDLPGKEYEYPCGIMLPPLNTLFRNAKRFNPRVTGFVMSPVATKIQGVPAYQFIIMGTQYFFYINKEDRKDLFISTREKELFMLVGKDDEHAHLIYHRLLKPIKRSLGGRTTYKPIA